MKLLTAKAGVLTAMASPPPNMTAMIMAESRFLIGASSVGITLSVSYRECAG